MYASGGPRPAPGTVNKLFFDAIDQFHKDAALQYKADGKWHALSHATIEERARRVSLGLRALGVQRYDRVAILAENSPMWAIADYGCLTAGFTDVPIYPTLPAEQIPHILNDAGACAIFVSTPGQAGKIAEIRDRVPSLKHVISFCEPAPAGCDMTFAELLARGQAAESPTAGAEWRAAALAVDPDDIATLIYTSGTTGNPKGVMLTHDNLHSNVVASRTKIPFTGRDTMLSFLPLSHIFERMVDYLAWATGTCVAYAESIDTVPINMQEIRPTLMCAVPRLYEKMFARVLENALQGGTIKKNIFFWARAVADRWADEKLAGRTPGGLLAFQYTIALKLVFSKLQERTGGQLRFFVSGGAPLAPEINKFFYAAGLMILEGYGLTETSPVIAVNTPTAFRLGTVGKIVEGVEVQIAEDGEILSRGPHIMKGYYNNPTATAEAIDSEGWFHTGDIGALEDGYLRITDRKKDLIVTAGGKNIAPQPIENRIKTNKYITEVVMIGDKRKYPVLLVVPNFDQLEKWAAYKNIIWTSRAQLLTMPTINAKIQKEVAKQLDGLAKYETPKKIALLEHEFSIEKGELTPSMKVKRRVIDRNYTAVIDALYAEDPVSTL
jgi:long-chain acyl-CoA synthetase